MAEPISIGTTEHGHINIDIDRLIGSHLAIVANAGGGKSGMIRKLLERTHGHIQHIVIDIEDEFYTLRQKHEYVIAGGEDGDCPAKIENAAGLARAALTHGFSLIAQINDLGTADAGQFLREFLESMLTAPRDLWRPCLIVIDEAQRYDQSIIQMLTERGRKRGFTAVLASQRLPKIDANVRGDINNWIMGRVGQSLDRRIMADQLGFTPTEAKEKLQRMKSRHFWGFGPALADDPQLFRVGDVETTMVKPGQAKVITPPPPEAMQAILAGLAVAQSPDDDKVLKGSGISKSPELLKSLAAKDAEIERLNDEITIMQATGQQQLDAVTAENKALRKIIDGAWTDIQRIVPSLPLEQIDPISTVRPSPAIVQPKAPKKSPSEKTELNTSAIKMIDMLDRIAPAKVTWSSLAAMIGNKPRGGNFNAARKGMRESGRIVENGHLICSASNGKEGMSRDEAIGLWKEVLSARAPDMIDVLFTYPNISRQELADRLGVAAKGGHWNNSLSQLTRNGVVTEYNGLISLSDPLPGQKPE